jgi:hypothetical protein
MSAGAVVLYHEDARVQFDDVQLNVAALDALPVPTGLTATPVSATRIDLAWTAVPAATGYDIERDGVIVATDHPSTSYSDTGRTAGTAHTYRVRTVR